MIGAPGSGKTMLARRMPTILPPLSREEALETTKIHSVAGNMAAGGLLARRPFRAPHHTISQAALIGGGQSPRPGEVSLAHNGVLFLDELPEFGRSVLEVLRQPLEEKRVTVSRAKYSVEYPANFTLVAAMNPCPCGYYNHPAKECVCSPGAVHRYMSRISGPLMDRIDLHVEVTPVPAAELSAAAPGEPSAAVRERVVRAREVQAARFAGTEGVHTNAMMNVAMLRILSAGRRFGGAAGAGHGAAVALGAGLRPHSESGPHDRRSGGARNHSGGRCGRSDQLPLAGPGKLGAVKGGRKGGERKEFVILQAACLGMLSGAEVCTPVFRSPGFRIAGFPDRRVSGPPGTALGLAGCRVSRLSGLRAGPPGRCRGRAFELSGSSGFRVDGAVPR